jgi:hypothetical protein
MDTKPASDNAISPQFRDFLRRYAIAIEKALNFDPKARADQDALNNSAMLIS